VLGRYRNAQAFVTAVDAECEMEHRNRRRRL
jgi:hypothetical protein